MSVTAHAIETASGHRARRRGRWSAAVFAPVGDGSTRRRASDAVRLVLSALVVGGSIVAIQLGVDIEHDAADWLHPPPSGIRWLVSALWFLGSIGAIVALVGIALLARRRRLARDTA